MKNVVVASFAAAAAVFALASSASAQTLSAPKVYGNLGYTYVNDRDSDANANVLTGRLGVRLHPNFALEGEAGFGIGSDTVTASGVSAKVKVDHTFAGYAVAYLPVTPQFELFARGGYGTTRISVKSGTVSSAGSEDSWNYGVGGQYMFDGVNGLRADYTRHDFRNNAGSFDAWGVSYVRKF
ncbi:MAG TPA: porin family protein [Caulobacteraceae bacterium]|jgi:hypothetical protein|nr:porin family protein [Caulobacteraceae bacterium]